MIDFLWKVVNFVVLAGLVVWLMRKYDVIDRVFGNYQREIKAELEASERLAQEAAALKAQMEQALAEADARAAEILAQAHTQAQREKAQLIANAKAEAERILEQARLTASYEHERQLQTLQWELVERILARAHERLARAVTRKDHQHLMERFLDELSAESLRLR